jgi:hypothetical protein
MKTIDTYLLDDDVLLKGTIKRKGLNKIFVPQENIQCGFSHQIIKIKNIGKIVFHNLNEIKNAKLGHLRIVE